MSNQGRKIQKVLGVHKNKDSFNTNNFVRVELLGKTNLVKPDKNHFILNNVEQFSLERNTSNCYRLNGKLEIITSNALYGAWGNTPTSSDWDPKELDVNHIGKHWILQITYPSRKDITTDMVTYTPSGDKTSKPDKGIQIDTITSTNITGRREQILLRTLQKHGIKEVGEYIHMVPTNPTEIEYMGFHRIISFEPGNEDYGLILETPWQGNEFYGTIKRVIEPSFEDVNFSNSFIIDQVESVDSNGTYFTVLDHLKLYHEKHDLRLGDFIDLRVNNFSDMNGIHEIIGIPNSDEFIIRQAITPVTNGPVLITTLPGVEIRYRVINGTPSEYYLRKFEVITKLKDCEVYSAAFSKNMFSDGVSNDVDMFHFDEDIDVSELRDNLGRPLSEIYLTINKRSSNGASMDGGFNGWGSIVSTFEENKGVVPYNNLNSSPYTLETTSFWVSDPTDVSGNIIRANPGHEYFGDFVEYNRSKLDEIVLSTVTHRIPLGRVVPNTLTEYTDTGEGYYYYPHNKIQIREFSNIIRTVKNKDDEILPDYVQYNNDGTVSWRDLLDIGSFEVGTKGVDHPFVNGCNYLYDNYAIYIRRQRPANNIDFTSDETNYVIIDQNSIGGNNC